MAGAAGSLALAGGRSGLAQASKRIEKLDPGVDAIIDTSQSIQELASGFAASSDPRRAGLVEGRRLPPVQRYP